MLQYHPLIVRSKTSLGSSREVVQSCGVSFTNYLYLVPLIISQHFCATCAKPNQTGPNYVRLSRRCQKLTHIHRSTPFFHSSSLPFPTSTETPGYGAPPMWWRRRRPRPSALQTNDKQVSHAASVASPLASRGYVAWRPHPHLASHTWPSVPACHSGTLHVLHVRPRLHPVRRSQPAPRHPANHFACRAVSPSKQPFHLLVLAATASGSRCGSDRERCMLVSPVMHVLLSLFRTTNPTSIP